MNGSVQPTAGPSGTQPSTKVSLTPELLSHFKPSKVFSDAVELSPAPSQPDAPAPVPPQIISVSFDDLGEQCLTVGEDEAFIIWDAKRGRKKKHFWSKKYGVALARFTHKGNILHASAKGDDHTIRYHSPHDNKYLAYFRGHTAKVRSLQVNPTSDEILSAGDDGTVRVWDLRGPNCQGIIQDMGGSTIAAWDNGGVVIAVACAQHHRVYLYGRDSMDHALCYQAPFHHALVVDVALEKISFPPPIPDFTSIAFSNNGEYILLGTSGEAHYLLDAFSLDILRRLTGHQPLGRTSGEELSFTVDSRFVISGSANGTVYVWDLGTEKIEKEKTEGPLSKVPAETLTPAVEIKPEAPEGEEDAEDRGTFRAVRFNSRFCMMAVGGETLSFWLPKKSEEDLVEQGF